MEILGIKAFIFFGFIFALVFFFVTMTLAFQSQIKSFINETFKKEKSVKVVIHYETNIYKTFWELIPHNDIFTLDKKSYIYDQKNIIRSKFGFVNEIHFFHNNPNSFKFENGKMKFTSEDLKLIKENDLFVKLLSMTTEKTIISFILFMVIINAILTIVLILKNFGVFDKMSGG